MRVNQCLVDVGPLCSLRCLALSTKCSTSAPTAAPPRASFARVDKRSLDRERLRDLERDRE